MNRLILLEEKIRNLLGLNKYEAKLYLALITGARGHREASNKSGVPLPRVYDTLSSLERRGLIVREGKWYTPIPPRLALGEIASTLIDESMRRAEEIKRLAISLDNIYSGREYPGSLFLVVRGLPQTLSFSMELLTRSRSAIFTLWKAYEKMDILLPYIEPHIGMMREKKVTVVLPGKISLRSTEKMLLEKIGARLCYSECLMLDSLILDDEKALIGVPDPSRKGEVISIYIGDSEFASALARSVVRHANCPTE